MKHKLESRLPGEIIKHLRYTDDTTLMAESEEELKSLLMKVKEESEKVDLKLNIHKMKIMESGPITSWQIDGETVADFIFLRSKITADGDCRCRKQVQERKSRPQERHAKALSTLLTRHLKT